MILYFSATGNSEYVAQKIGNEIEDETLNLLQKFQTNDRSEIHSKKPWIIVSPTYAWRIPRILQKWFLNTKLTGNRNIYFIMTCGGSIGNANAYIQKLCAAKAFNLLGCIPIVMPDNYLVLFRPPTKEQALKIIKDAEESIHNTALLIKNEQPYPQSTISFTDKLNSGIVNDLFYPFFVHDKRFYSTNDCISCGICKKVCPMNNISLPNGKPVWNKHCTHCMACICRCPKKAIEYGKRSKGLERYTFPINL